MSKLFHTSTIISKARLSFPSQLKSIPLYYVIGISRRSASHFRASDEDLAMALHPKYPSHRLTSGDFDKDKEENWAPHQDESPALVKEYNETLFGTTHTLELYLDYVCPFSKKQFMGLYNYVSKHRVPENVNIIFRHQVQPWHPSSTLVHEAGLQSAKYAWFWCYSYLLFEHQTSFFDVNVVNETRNQTYERLIALYQTIFDKHDGAVPENPVKEMREALLISDNPGQDGALNVGNQVTEGLKWAIKLGRQNGIHVSPTVLWNGVVENGINSSFGEKEWVSFFEKNI